MKHVVLVSGGLDSAVLLAWVNEYKEKSDIIQPVWVHYGQLHAERELEAAKAIVEFYDLRLLRYVIIPGLAEKWEVPKGKTYDDVNVKNTRLYVPNRNMILIGIAANVAFPNGIVYYGAHAMDTPYADCTVDFVEKLNVALQAATYGKVSLKAPLVNMTKSEIVKLGARLGAPLELTYSCYTGYSIHCGECPTCLQRKQAFKEAGIEDPTQYEKV